MESKSKKKRKVVSSKFIDKKVSIALSSIILSVFFISGCTSKYEQIPREYYYQLESQTDDLKVNFDSLKNLKSLTINLDNEGDLSWINQCENLEELFLVLDNNKYSSLEMIEGFPKLRDFRVILLSDTGVFSEEYFAFLEKSYNLEKISIEGMEICASFIEKFHSSLTDLSISKNVLNTKIDFTKFSNLKVLDFKDEGVYNIMMFLDRNDCRFFENNNVKVFANGGENVSKKIKSIDDEIYSIMFNSNLDIIPIETDVDKLNSILKCVLYELKYDSDLKKWEEEVGIRKHYYEEGYLDGALNIENDKVICGNYAALFQALASRVDLESYYIISKNHAYNLINIDGKYYYTDSTNLDSEINKHCSRNQTIISFKRILEDEGEEFNWYLMDPNVYIDEEHVSLNIPSHIDIARFESKDKGILYVISTNGKPMLICSAALLVLFFINKSNSKENEESCKIKKRIK